MGARSTRHSDDRRGSLATRLWSQARDARVSGIIMAAWSAESSSTALTCTTTRAAATPTAMMMMAASKVIEGLGLALTSAHYDTLKQAHVVDSLGGTNVLMYDGDCQGGAPQPPSTATMAIINTPIAPAPTLRRRPQQAHHYTGDKRNDYRCNADCGYDADGK